MTQPNNLPTEASERKKLPITSGVIDYFPLALAKVADVSRVGNEQHNPGQPLHWDRSKSRDHADCLARHLIERGTDDTDGLPHTAKLAWRALAMLQEEEEGRLGVPRYNEVPVNVSPSLSILRSEEPWRRHGIVVLGTAPAMPRVYIAGPMRGYARYNFPAFLEADKRARDLGWDTLNPAVLDQENGLDFINDPDGAQARWDTFTQEDIDGVILRDIACILSLDPDTDAIAMLPGWERSTGAVAEFMLARWRKLRVLDARDFGPLSNYYTAELGNAVRDFLMHNGANAIMDAAFRGSV